MVHLRVSLVFVSVLLKAALVFRPWAQHRLWVFFLRTASVKPNTWRTPTVLRLARAWGLARGVGGGCRLQRVQPRGIEACGLPVAHAVGDSRPHIRASGKPQAPDGSGLPSGNRHPPPMRV